MILTFGLSRSPNSALLYLDNDDQNCQSHTNGASLNRHYGLGKTHTPSDTVLSWPSRIVLIADLQAPAD